MNPSASELIKEARKRAGLTQSELAQAMGTTQSAVARLERRGSSLTLRSLDRALAAMGKRLVLSARDRGSDLDETLIIANLRLSPGERLDRFTRSYESLRTMLASARRV